MVDWLPRYLEACAWGGQVVADMRPAASGPIVRLLSKMVVGQIIMLPPWSWTMRLVVDWRASLTITPRWCQFCSPLGISAQLRGLSLLQPFHSRWTPSVCARVLRFALIKRNSFPWWVIASPFKWVECCFVQDQHRLVARK